MNRALLAVAALSAALTATPAAAKSSGAPSSTSAPGPGSKSLSLWADFDPGSDGIGAGLRVAFPLVPEGFLRSPKVKDELVLEVGADYLHYSYSVGPPFDAGYSWNGFLIVGGVAWNFWLTPRFALYPKIDLGYLWGRYQGWDPVWGTYYTQHSYGGIFLQGAAGLIYRLDAIDLRLELGSGLLRLGVGFKI